MVKRHIPLAILLASIVLIARASAEEFPNRPITWVVPFAPGGITDTTSRIVAEEMSRTLGQSVLIDNRGGGGGTVGTEQVARAKPDGYTMIYGTQGTILMPDPNQFSDTVSVATADARDWVDVPAEAGYLNAGRGFGSRWTGTP